MKTFEIWDNKRYLFTVALSENPMFVLQQERSRNRLSRLRMIMIDNGVRSQIEGPSLPEPEEDFGYAEELDEAA